MKNYFSNRPIRNLQLAVDGAWENALHITGDRRDDAEVETWLTAASEDLALEAFFETPNGLGFVGVRLANLSPNIQHDKVRLLVRAFHAHSGMAVDDFIGMIESLLGVDLFRMRPHFLELGKVNAWRSFRSVVFWREGDDRTPMDGFCAAVAANPRYLDASALPYAIEFGFNGNIPHWYGHPVSVCGDAKHSISIGAVEQLLE